MEGFRKVLRRLGAGRGGRDERGETLALLVVWPALIAAILLMLVHAFIVTNAQAEAELAASQGLRTAWQEAASANFLDDPSNSAIDSDYQGAEPHPDVLKMVESAKNAVARAASTEQGWRWWTPGVAEVQSDWCAPFGMNPSGLPDRPTGSDTGWVRVVVSGEVFGPLAALWPNRWDRVYAVAQGPALLVPPAVAGSSNITVPAALPTC